MAKSGLSRGNIADQRFIEDVANNYIVDAFIDVSAVAPGSGLPAATNEQQYVVDAGSGSILGGWGTITGVTDKCIIKYNTTIAKWQLVFSPVLAEEGTTLYNKESDKILAFDGAEWIIASGAGGGDTTLLFEDFESTSPTAFFTSVSGTLTLSDDILNPLVQETTAKITQTSALIDDYIEKIIELPIAKTDWSLAPIKIETLNEVTGGIGEWALEISESVDDVTYTQVAYAEINNGTQTLKNITKLNEATLYLKLKYKVVVADDTTTLRIGRIKIASDAFEVGQITKKTSINLSGNGSEAITANTENIPFNGTGTGWNSSTYEYTIQYNNTQLSLSTMVVDNANVDRETHLYKNGVFYRLIQGSRSTFLDDSKGGTYVSSVGEFSKGDTLSIRVDNGMTLSNVLTDHYLNILETAYADGVIVDAASFNMTQTKILPVDVGSGTVAQLTFTDLEIGKNYFLNYQASMGETSGGSSTSLSAVHDGITIATVRWDTTSGSLNGGVIGTSTYFTATTDILTFSASVGEGLRGNGTKSETFAELTAVPPAFLALDISSERENSVSLSGNDGRVITFGTEDIQFNGSGKGWETSGDSHKYRVQESGSVIRITTNTHCTTSGNRELRLYKNGVFYKLIGNLINNTVTNGTYVSKAGEFSKDDLLSIRFNLNAGTLSNLAESHYLNIVETYAPQAFFIAGQIALTEANTSGIEYRTNEKVDGEWIYARTWKYTGADITSGDAVYFTTDAFLKPVGHIKYTTEHWVIDAVSIGGSYSQVYYHETTGDIRIQAASGWRFASGTIFTLKYTK